MSRMETSGARAVVPITPTIAGCAACEDERGAAARWPMDARTDPGLERARERVLGDGTVDERGVVRPEIVQSWERSRRAGVDADHLALPYDPDLDFEGSLIHCARPVLDDLTERRSALAGRARASATPA